MSNHRHESSKRRRLSRSDDSVAYITPSSNRPTTLLTPQQPHPSPLPESMVQQQDLHFPSSKYGAPQRIVVDSPLSSENIESALCMIDRNTRRKFNTSDQVLQALHDLFRWSRLSNRDHRDFFLHEFVWEFSGTSRVLKFLKAYNMGDTFLCQLLQTNHPFNE